MRYGFDIDDAFLFISVSIHILDEWDCSAYSAQDFLLLPELEKAASAWINYHCQSLMEEIGLEEHDSISEKIKQAGRHRSQTLGPDQSETSPGAETGKAYQTAQ
jgi:hypothetical protein